MMMSWGVLITYGVFLNPLVEEFGWSRATVSGAHSVSSVITGVLGIVAGWGVDRLGPRIVVMISGVLLGAGYMLMSQVQSVWGLYVFFGVLVGTGMGGMWVPPLSTVARWFTQRRSLATGVVLSGMTVGHVIAPPIVSRMIIAIDWRHSYLVLGVVVMAVVVIAAQFLRKEPRVSSLPPDEDGTTVTERSVFGLTFREAVRTKQFWMVSTTFFFAGIGALGVLIHLVPHAIELGVSEVAAATVLAVAGAVGIPGNFLVGGLLGDRIGNRKAFIIGLVLMIVSLVILLVAHELWVLYVFAVAYGMGMSGMTTSESPLVARLFGLRHHGSIFAATGVAFTAGGALGPLLWGYIFDRAGSYAPAFWVSAGLGAVGLVLVVLLRPTRKLKSGRL